MIIVKQSCNNRSSFTSDARSPFIFCSSRENHRIMPTAQGEAEGSVGTKNPASSCSRPLSEAENCVKTAHPADCVPKLSWYGLSVSVIVVAIQVELLMPDRPKVRFQTKRDTGVYAVHRRSRFTSGTCVLIRRDCASEPETALHRKSTPLL